MNPSGNAGRDHDDAQGAYESAVQLHASFQRMYECAMQEAKTLLAQSITKDDARKLVDEHLEAANEKLKLQAEYASLYVRLAKRKDHQIDTLKWQLQVAQEKQAATQQQLVDQAREVTYLEGVFKCMMKRAQCGSETAKDATSRVEDQERELQYLNAVFKCMTMREQRQRKDAKYEMVTAQSVSDESNMQIANLEEQLQAKRAECVKLIEENSEKASRLGGQQQELQGAIDLVDSFLEQQRSFRNSLV